MICYLSQKIVWSFDQIELPHSIEITSDFNARFVVPSIVKKDLSQTVVAKTATKAAYSLRCSKNNALF